MKRLLFAVTLLAGLVLAVQALGYGPKWPDDYAPDLRIDITPGQTPHRV